MKYEACRIMILGTIIGYRCSKCFKRFDKKEYCCPYCRAELYYKKSMGAK